MSVVWSILSYLGECVGILLLVTGLALLLGLLLKRIGA